MALGLIIIASFFTPTMGTMVVMGKPVVGQIPTSNSPSASSGPPTTQWIKTYGGQGWDEATSLIQTSDGGYALAGLTVPYGGSNDYDVWLVKTDSSGNMQWNQTYAGSEGYVAMSVIQTSDGGYALAGTENTSAGYWYAWLLKTDSAGNEQWNKTYDYGAWSSVIQTSDGGYALAEIAVASSGNGAYDIRLVKTDSSGNMQWDQAYGSVPWSRSSVIQTSDGGYALAGTANTSIANGYDFLLVKTDSSGNMQWSKTYGGTGLDEAYSVIQTSDGGYALAGTTTSYGAGGYDFWLVKTDSSGNTQWNQTYGGNDDDEACSVIQTSDRGYALGGWTNSPLYSNRYYFYLVKIGAGTGISVICSPNPAVVGSPVTCTATVSGSNPTGTVTWSTTSTIGSFSSSICTLSSGGCLTTYTDTSPGTVTITASYSGDANNAPSSGSTTLTSSALLQYLLFSDEFNINSQLSSMSWQINSPVLQSITSYDSSTYGANVGIGNLDSPYLSGGLAWTDSEPGTMTGITTMSEFTPPFTVQMNVTKTSSGPIFLYVSNSKATILLGILLDDQVFVQDQNQLTSSSDLKQFFPISSGLMYTLTITVSLTTASANVSYGGHTFSDTFTLPSTNDYGLYVTLGCYDGGALLHEISPPGSVSALFSSVVIQSNKSWIVDVKVNADIINTGRVGEVSGASVNLTNIISQKTYATTSSNGMAVFSGIPSGTYIVSVIDIQPTGGKIISNQTILVVGNPSDPTQPTISTQFILQIPSPSPIQIEIHMVSSTGTSQSDTSGYHLNFGMSPMNIVYLAVPSGGTGEYSSIIWYVNDSALPMGYEQINGNGWRYQAYSSDLQCSCTFYSLNSKSINTFNVTAQAQSIGDWYGVNLANLPSTSVGPVSNTSFAVLENPPYEANIRAISGSGTFNGKYFISLNSGNDQYQGIFYECNGLVYLDANVTDGFVPGFEEIKQLIFVHAMATDYPYYGVILNVSDVAVPQDGALQFYSTLPMMLKFPTGTSIDQLTGTKFNVTLSPSDKWAEAGDIVNCVLQGTNLISLLAPSEKGTLYIQLKAHLIDIVFQELVSEGASTSFELSSQTPIDLQEHEIKILWDVLPNLLLAIPVAMDTLGFSAATVLGVSQALTAFIGGTALVFGVMSFVPTYIRMMEQGNVYTEFQIKSLTPMEAVSVDPMGPTPNVLMESNGTIAGWNGTWQGTSNGMIHSLFTSEQYSFGVPKNNYTLVISTPPGVSSTEYNISITFNGVTNFVSGVVDTGSPISYNVSSLSQLSPTLNGTLSASPSVVKSGNIINVTMNLTNENTSPTNMVSPTDPTLSGTGNATLISGPSPSSATIYGKSSQIFTWTYTATSEGIIQFYDSVQSTDQNSGSMVSTGLLTSNTVIINTTPPFVAINFPSANGNNGWFNSSPVVGTVTTTDPSIVTSITCKGAQLSNIQGLGTPNATAIITVVGEGVHSMVCTANDSAGNSGAAAGSSNTATIEIDTMPPATTLTIGLPKQANATGSVYVASATPFTLTATDDPNGSGVNSTYYNVENSTYNSGWLVYSIPFNLTGLAYRSYNVSYYSVDNAGNTEQINTVNVTVSPDHATAPDYTWYIVGAVIILIIIIVIAAYYMMSMRHRTKPAK